MSMCSEAVWLHASARHAQMLYDRNEMERLIAIEFEAPRDASDFKQRFMAKANVYIALVNLLADLCNSPDASFKVRRPHPRCWHKQGIGLLSFCCMHQR